MYAGGIIPEQVNFWCAPVYIDEILMGSILLRPSKWIMTMVSLDSKYIKHNVGVYMNPLFQRNSFSTHPNAINSFKGFDTGMW